MALESALEVPDAGQRADHRSPGLGAVRAARLLPAREERRSRVHHVPRRTRTGSYSLDLVRRQWIYLSFLLAVIAGDHRAGCAAGFPRARWSLSGAGLAELATLDGLFALNVESRQRPRDHRRRIGAARRSTQPRLARLRCDGGGDGGGGGAAKMRHSDVPGHGVAGDDGFVALSRSQWIENISGATVPQSACARIYRLANMPKLEDGCGMSCLTSMTARWPPSRFPALRDLMPMDVPDAGYRHIAKCLDLEVLTLMYCRETGDGATEHIVRLPGLKKYSPATPGSPIAHRSC